mmetsp:Transcript_32548/g.97119  ORF Transcript_32548/g.97119 Transcript_32548/m.97119 type:complete len:315 (+) Transcript_32548:1081-2025(+)
MRHLHRGARHVLWRQRDLPWLGLNLGEHLARLIADDRRDRDAEVTLVAGRRRRKRRLAFGSGTTVGATAHGCLFQDRVHTRVVVRRRAAAVRRVRDGLHNAPLGRRRCGRLCRRRLSLNCCFGLTPAPPLRRILAGACRQYGRLGLASAPLRRRLGVAGIAVGRLRRRFGRALRVRRHAPRALDASTEVGKWEGGAMTVRERRVRWAQGAGLVGAVNWRRRARQRGEMAPRVGRAMDRTCAPPARGKEVGGEARSISTVLAWQVSAVRVGLEGNPSGCRCAHRNNGGGRIGPAPQSMGSGRGMPSRTSEGMGLD